MSSKKRFAQEAEIKQDLVVYDGPQLVLLHTDRDYRMLAVAVQRGGFSYPMFGTEVNEKLFDEYAFGRVDLRYVFYATKFKAKYFFDYSEEYKSSVKLVRAMENEITNESFYPEHGIFARIHTSELKSVFKKSEKVRFHIDGAWESEDFSRFHGKLADVYSTTYIAKKSSMGHDLTRSERDFMKESIQGKNWQGGGSYLGFYAAVKNEARHVHPLRVAGISYNSPGYIDLAGEESVMDDVISSIRNYIDNFIIIDKLYKDIYRTLRKEKILRANWRAGFQSPAAEVYVSRRTRDLAATVQLVNYENIIRDCGGNEALFAKVLLSFCRRLNEVAKFAAEGRVKVPNTITP